MRMSWFRQNNLYVLAICAGTGIVTYCVFRSLCRTKDKKRRSYCPPANLRRDLKQVDENEWENVGRVKKIYIYPVKSCKGIAVKEAFVEKSGLTNASCRDRSLVISGGNGAAITGCKVSSTLLICPTYDDYNENVITLQFPNLEPIKINLSSVEKENEIHEVKVPIHGEIVTGFDCGDEVAEWMTKALGHTCRLLYNGSIPTQRATVNQAKKFPLMNDDDAPLYGNEFSYLLLLEESVNDLRSLANCETYPENFRPNILVEGCPAYDDDLWSYVKIGDAVFRNIKPCNRCPFTTINYKTGERNQSLEPLKTLRSYRIPEGFKGPVFGSDLGMEKQGLIKEGDAVLVLR